MKTLLLIIVKNAESTLPQLFEQLLQQPLGSLCEVLFVDDASTDQTTHLAKVFFEKNSGLHSHFLINKVPQGFGGNQKVGLRYAIDHGFDAVAVFYPQDRYSLLDMKMLFSDFNVDTNTACVLGTDLFFLNSHQEKKADWTYRILARSFHYLLNKISGYTFYDWSTSCRIYSTIALKSILYELNTHARHFDIEILLQLQDMGKKISEKPLSSSQRPFYFGLNTTSVVDGIKAALRYRFQRYHLFFDIRFHPELLSPLAMSSETVSVYQEKKVIESPHTAVMNDEKLVPASSSVLDIGCATGYVATGLKKKKQCRVVGVDMLSPKSVSSELTDYKQINLEQDPQQIRNLILTESFDVVMMLDVLEHLSFPELFLLSAFRMPLNKPPKYIFSTANVAFVVVRLLLLMGVFNYGTKGILDVTHKRLFTLRTFRNLMEQTGFLVVGRRYFPFPFDMLGLPKGLCYLLQMMNQFLIKISPSLFAYQILYEAIPLAAPQKALENVISTSSFMAETDKI